MLLHHNDGNNQWDGEKGTQGTPTSKPRRQWPKKRGKDLKCGGDQ
jgi:hypothetical protein